VSVGENKNAASADSGTPASEKIELLGIDPGPDRAAATNQANLAIPAGEIAASGSLFVDNSAQPEPGAMESAFLDPEILGADSAPLDARSMEILDLLHPPKQKSWSGFVRTGYSWIDHPRISQRSTGGGGDSILTAGLSLDYLLPGSDEDRKFKFSAAYNYDFYTKHSELNSDNANVAFSGQFRQGVSCVSFNASWLRTNGSNRLVADEINSDTVSATLGLSREISSKTSLNIGACYGLNSYESFLSSSSIACYGGLSYAFSPKTQIGLRYSAGIAEQSNSEDRTYHAADLTFNFKPGSKTTLNGSIGYQENQSDSQDYQSDGPGMVFSLGSTYNITEKTSLSLSGNRGSSGSPLQQNQDVVTTRGVLAINWRISKLFSYTSGLAYAMDEFSDAGVLGQKQVPAGSNNYWSIRNSLSYRISDHWGADLYYEYSNNDAANDENSYQSNRVGANLKFVF
jgi:hypothetical protein